MSEYAINQNGSTSNGEITEDVCGFLEKKEDGNKWIKYWVVLLTGRLKHYTCIPSSQDDTNGGPLIGWIDLTRDTKCTISKQKGHYFPFYVEKPPGKRYLFRVASNQSRQRWVQEIETSIKQLHVMPAINSQILLDTREKLASQKFGDTSETKNTAVIDSSRYKQFDLLDKKTRSLSLESNDDSDGSGNTADDSNVTFFLENDRRDLTDDTKTGRSSFKNIFLTNNKKGQKYQFT